MCSLGHAYYFLEDVYPRMAHGRRPLKTPGFVKALFPADQIQSSRPTAAPAAAPAAAQFPAPGVVPPPVGGFTISSVCVGVPFFICCYILWLLLQSCIDG